MASSNEDVTYVPQTGGKIHYRAIHAKNMWRKVNSHTSLDKAILGKDGAVGLFARKVRIDYEKQGDPLFVLVWEGGADSGYVIKPDSSSPNGIRVARAPMRDLMEFDDRGQVSLRTLDAYFAA